MLIVDDEPDVHSVTRLSLKALKPGGRSLELLSARTGAEAVELMSQRPEISVVLLDVIMETDHAGLDACKAIRATNPFVRILLRTGQPGLVPERQTIDEYDVDGYLAKAELTSNRLYTAVRTAIRAWEQLVELERHRRYLAAVHDCVASLHSDEPLEAILERVLATAVALCPASIAVLLLETFEETGNPQRTRIHLATDPDPIRAELASEAVISAVARDPEGASEGGLLVRLTLHHDLGFGWIYLKDAEPDALTHRVLPVLAAHAANALYSAVAQKMLAHTAPVFDEMIL